MSADPFSAGVAAPARRLHAAVILDLLASGKPVAIETIAAEIYVGRARPTDWAASLRSTINRLRRSKRVRGAVILCEAEGYRLRALEPGVVSVPGIFRRRQGFLPLGPGSAPACSPLRRAA